MMSKVIILLILYYAPVQVGTSTWKTRVSNVKALLEKMRQINLKAQQGGRNTGPINVTVGLSVRKIIKVDETMQTLTVNAWFRQVWKNKDTVWNSSVYGGITELSVDPNLLWNPEIVLHNSVDKRFTGGAEKYKSQIIVHSDGTTHWKNPAVYEFSCPLHIRYFPFDEQTCYLMFSSWQHNTKRVHLHKEQQIKISTEFIEGVTWKLMSTRIKRGLVKYDCCPDPFDFMQFFITIRRKPLYFIVTIIVPSLFILSLTMITFYLPPDCGERISLTVTIFLAITFFMEITNSNLPVYSKEIPLLSLFFISVIAVSSASAFCTGLVLVIHFKGAHRDSPVVPSWVRHIVILKIGRYVLPEEVRMWEMELSNEKQHFILQTSSHSKVGAAPKEENQAVSLEPLSSSLDYNSCFTSGKDIVSSTSTKTEVLSKLLIQLMALTDYLKKKEFSQNNDREWRLLASIIDRVLLIFLSILSLILSLAFLWIIYTRGQ